MAIQDQIFSALYDALLPGGILVLGFYEMPYTYTHYSFLEPISDSLNIFLKNI